MIYGWHMALVSLKTATPMERKAFAVRVLQSLTGPGLSTFSQGACNNIADIVESNLQARHDLSILLPQQCSVCRVQSRPKWEKKRSHM